MRWRDMRRSSNIRNAGGGGGGFGGGFGRGLPGGFPGGMGRGRVVRAGGGMGIGTIVIILIAAWLFGINPLALLGGDMGGGYSTAPAPQGQQSAQGGVTSEMEDFVARVLGDTEDTWSAIFERAGEDYPEPTLTLFQGSVRSACGQASAASGPFYCPGDRNLYIDLDFYNELRDKFGAPGDTAQAYVLAHEVGHHVQNVMGILQQTQGQGNEASIRTELQADCFAGVWAHHTQQKGLLQEGDVEEALTAASAVGDDAIQQRTQGYVVPESFNHGTSEQRADWFGRGFREGTVESCDTFSADI